MKKLSIVLIILILAGCGLTPELSPIVTSEAYGNALLVCDKHGGVKMVSQSIGVKYTAFCNDDIKIALE